MIINYKKGGTNSSVHASSVLCSIGIRMPNPWTGSRMFNTTPETNNIVIDIYIIWVDSTCTLRQRPC